MPSQADSHWADASAATVTPGVQMVTDGAHCTANFIFEQSGNLDSDGDAFGVTSTLAIVPLAGSTGVSDLRKGLAYANAGAGADCTLAPGTEPFVGYP